MPYAEAADGDDTPTEEIVVTGTLSPRSAALMPSSTSVYDAAAIEASQPQGLSEFFRFIPGLHLSQSGARGGRASMSLRGLDPNHVLVMVDGVRLNDPTDLRGGAVDPTTLALLDVERIEVVRGPLSAAYGSDALAGAINVISHRTESDQSLSLLLFGGGGRFETGAVGGRASAGLGWAGVSLAGSYEANGDAVSDGGYRGGNLKASLDADLPGNADLRATLRFSDTESKSFPEASGGPAFARLRELEERDNQELSASFALHQATTDWLELELLVTHSHRWEALDSPGIFPEPGFPPEAVPPPTASTSDWGRTQLAASARMRPLSSLQLAMGADFYREKGVGDAIYFPDEAFKFRARFERERRVGGVFAEGLYRFDPGLAISLSVRGDFPDEARSVWSPAVGGTFEVPRTPLTLFGNWSRGFKLPSFFALGHPQVGNPDLKAERSEGWEVGLRSRLFGERVFGRLAYFDIEVKNLIDFADGKLINQSRVLSRGVEVEVEIRFSRRLSLGRSATFNPTDIVGSSDELPQRPRWQGELHVFGRPLEGLESLELGLRVLFVGDSQDFSIPTGDRTLENYSKVNVTASWQPHDRVKLLLAIENLFDAEYQEAVGFPAVGIYPRVGVELRL